MGRSRKDEVVSDLAMGRLKLFQKMRWGSGLTIDYGLTLDELRYILDPKDVYRPDFPGETFCVLKAKECEFGEYRTRHFVLEAGIGWKY
jgi:hypothetical protein